MAIRQDKAGAGKGSSRYACACGEIGKEGTKEGEEEGWQGEEKKECDREGKEREERRNACTWLMHAEVVHGDADLTNP